MPPHIVQTARLTLRPLGEQDRDEFIRVFTISRDHFAPWSATGEAGRDPGAIFDEQLQRAAAECASGAGFRRAGFLLEGGALAGLFAFGQIFRGPFRSCYAGWRISADCLGRGLCTEAMAKMLDIAFAPEPEGLGLHRVQANIIPENIASLRVAEKLGMRREGLALRYLHIGGAWRDHIMFARTAEEHGAQ
ncbi:MAG: GNAT family N-acetyltransferase [Phycisphaerales bacterium JB039]